MSSCYQKICTGNENLRKPNSCDTSKWNEFFIDGGTKNF